MPKDKKKRSKPKPSDLGTGGASRAAKKLKNRHQQIEEALGGSRKRKDMKKQKGRK